MKKPTKTYKPAGWEQLEPYLRRSFEWSEMTQYFCSTQFRRIKLAVVIQPVNGGTYDAVALQTDADSFEGALESHSHQLLGNYASLEHAKFSAEAYMRAWLEARRKKKPSKKKCKTIEKVS